MNKNYNYYIGILPKCELQNIISTEISCPLGQIVIASYAKQRIKDLETIVFYCEKDSDEEILYKTKEYINEGKNILAGITLNAGNVKNTFSLAKEFHKMGIDVIVGGPEAWMCWEMWKEIRIGKNIMEAHPYINSMVLGAGERVVTEILKGQSLNTIPNLVYRDNDGKIYQNDIKSELQKIDFKNITVDYTLLSKLEKYRGVTYLWSNNCHLANKERCYFCGRINLGNDFREPQKVWEELEMLYKRGIKQFYNTVDAIIDLPKFKKFINNKPNGMTEDIHKVFINAHQLNSQLIPFLKRLNAVVSIGIESFSLFDKVGKHPTTMQDNYGALNLLREHNMKAILSFVIGLPEENIDSLKKNEEGIIEIVKGYGNIIGMLEISPLMVTTGSKAFKNLMEAEKSRYENKSWPFDSIEMSQDYFHFKCCQIERSDAIDFIQRIYKKVNTLNPNIKFDIKGITPEEKTKILL